MKVVQEVSLYDFEAWSGGRDTLNTLADWLDKDDFDSLESQIVDLIADEEGNVSDTALNDFLWFETDTIAGMLGFYDWESWLKAMEGDEEEGEDEEEDDD